MFYPEIKLNLINKRKSVKKQGRKATTPFAWDLGPGGMQARAAAGCVILQRPRLSKKPTRQASPALPLGSSLRKIPPEG
jgi:hypothetical protein